ncbi:uncharacterized protein LOC128857545 [Anastrepha ludens]|uniref:uncharacterized protein LOC128857545 n=1 Tax=Anastrepha ludens TaxID=28586 RepID=UPI0023AF755B|nr:uncharacterized protein LOC128857545 [Anastrepha ludens]
MQSLRCSLSILLALGICHLSLTLPAVRVKRQPDDLLSLEAESADALNSDLNPINAEAVSGDELERNKRKLPDATFEAKNAVLGFVFGKIDNFLDTKTRVIEQLDRANIEKNRQWDIRPPVPIRDFQTLVTAVVSPKIRSLGNIANDLTTGVLTTITAFSGSSAGNGSANPNAGLGNIVSKFLGFSGPILQGSAAGPAGGGTTPAPDSDERREFSHLANSRLIRPARATDNSNNKYDDVPEFDRKQVSLDFPDELFNKSFATLTNISKSFSRLIMNSARRYSRFVLFFKPVFGDALVVKGWEDPTTTTTTPKTTTTRTTSNPLDTLNEV